MAVKLRWIFLSVVISVFFLVNMSLASSQCNDLFKEGELLIKFRPGTLGIEKSNAHAQVGSKVLREFPGLGIQHLKLRGGQSVEAAVIIYSKNPNVEYAEPNYFLQQAVFPNDPDFGIQWNLHNVGQVGIPLYKAGLPDADIDAPEAWSITTGSSDVVVAVLDSGIAYTHPELRDNVWTNDAELYGVTGVDDDANGYVDDIYGIDPANDDSDPWDDNGHGTYVSGVIGASGDNGIGIAGINWNVKILSCKHLAKGGSGWLDDAVECFEYVRALKDRGVNIVATNNSYIGGFSQALLDAIDAQPDILCVAGAGNATMDNDLKHPYPANLYLPNIISVGASTRGDEIALFSNWGRRSVHLAAPGEDILVTAPPDGFLAEVRGTSIATPHVTGVAALLKAANPDWDWREIKNRILAGGDPNADFLEHSISGKRLNAFNAITCTDRPLFSALALGIPPIETAAAFPKQVVPGTTYVVSALSINCGQPVGPVTITEYGSGTVTGLVDNGIWPDLEEGDGIFSGIFVPSLATGPLVMSSPAGGEVLMSDLRITTSSLPPGEDRDPYNQTLTATGGVGPYTWSIALGSLPDEMTLDKATGEISGVPMTAGTYPFTVKVADSIGTEDYQNFSLVIYPLRVDINDFPPADRGASYSFSFTATGGEEPLAWELVSGAFPDGLSLDPESGEVSGVPTTSGWFNFKVRVTDSVGATAEGKEDIWVYGLRIWESLGVGRPGIPYSGSFSVTGVFPPITWELISGSLPPGLSLDPATGEISGVPLTVEGAISFYFTVQVTDSTDEWKQRDSFITIHPMKITTFMFGLPNALVGVPYSKDLSAEAGFPPYTWSVVKDALPDGLTLDPVSGEISGVPTKAGTFYFTVRVTDTDGAMDEKRGTIDVKPRLWLSTSSLPDGLTGQAYSQSLTAVSGVTPYTWSITSGTLPDGLSLDSSTGAISGIPTITGTFTFDVKVVDALSDSDSKTFTIAVYDGLEISTVELPSGTSGVTYAAQLKASGGPTPYAWSITSGALPDGLSLNEATGAISGTPTITGVFTFSIQVTDALNVSASKTFTITVYEELKVLNDTVPSGTVGYMYYVDLEASGGQTPYGWSITGGLPEGVSFSELSSVISGKPYESGTFTFTIKVTDARSVSASKTFTMTIYDVLKVLSDALQAGITGSAYVDHLYASGGLKPYNWSIISGALPDGLSLDSATGTVSGIPTVTGTFTLNVQVSDAQPVSATRTITLTICDELALLAEELPVGMTGAEYSEQLDATGGLEPYVWSITTGSLPEGLSLDTEKGVISGGPLTAGTKTFNVQVKDAISQTAQQAFTITIIDPFTITTSSMPHGVTGISYLQVLEAENGLEPYTWSIASGTLPDGIGLDITTGTISGTPAVSGTFAFTAGVVDADSLQATRELSIIVYDTLTITTLSLPDAMTGQAYGVPLTVSGGMPPYTWSVKSGELPFGLDLDGASGVLSGTPASGGTFEFTVQVMDGNGYADSRKLSVSAGSMTAYYMQPLAGCGQAGDYMDRQPVMTSLAVTGGTCASGDTLAWDRVRSRYDLVGYLDNGGYSSNMHITGSASGNSLSFLIRGSGGAGYVMLVEVDLKRRRVRRVLSTISVDILPDTLTEITDISGLSGTVRAGHTVGIALRVTSTERFALKEISLGKAGGGPGHEQWVTFTEMPAVEEIRRRPQKKTRIIYNEINDSHVLKRRK